MSVRKKKLGVDKIYFRVFLGIFIVLFLVIILGGMVSSYKGNNVSSHKELVITENSDLFPEEVKNFKLIGKEYKFLKGYIFTFEKDDGEVKEVRVQWYTYKSDSYVKGEKYSEEVVNNLIDDFYYSYKYWYMR